MHLIQKILGALAVSMTLASPLAQATPLSLYDANNSLGLTQPGWTAVSLADINNVTFTAVGNVFLSDRERGVANTDGAGGDVGNNDMWRDFIFADERTLDLSGPNPNVVEPAGLDITIAGLLANTVYAVQLWAFDEVSTQLRSSKWNGVSYSFDGADPDPTSLNDHVVRFNVLSNASGVAVLEGRVDFANRGPCCNVFVNGFSLREVPEPGTLALACLGIAGMTTRRRQLPA